MRTVSWHVQQLYGQYKGENVLSLTMDGSPVAGAEGQNGLFASAVKDGDKVYVKVDNTLDEPCAIVPAEASFTGEGKTLEANVPALSFTIFILEK